MAEENSSELRVWVGRNVDLEIKYETGETERLSLDVVADQSADFERGFLGEGTPLAKAILGKTAGSVVAYRAGDAVSVKILAVSAQLSQEPQDLTERREEVTRKAIDDFGRTSTIIYASSMGNKWGEMDPGALEEEDNQEDTKKGKSNSRRPDH